MKHQKATGGSDNYDKDAHNRLLEKAHAFCATVASKYAAPSPSGGTSSGGGTSGDASGDAAAAPEAAVEPEPVVDPAAEGDAATETAEAAAAAGVPALEVAAAQRQHLTHEALTGTGAPSAKKKPKPKAPKPKAAVQPAPVVEPAPVAAAPMPIVAPIPIVGTFVATLKPSAKAPVGKKEFTVSVPWDDAVMYNGAKLALQLPPTGRTVTTVLAKPSGGAAMSVKLTIPSTVETDTFALGAVTIISGPKPVQGGGGVPVAMAGGSAARGRGSRGRGVARGGGVLAALPVQAVLDLTEGVGHRLHLLVGRPHHAHEVLVRRLGRGGARHGRRFRSVAEKLGARDFRGEASETRTHAFTARENAART